VIAVIFVFSLQEMRCVVSMLINTLISSSSLKQYIFFQENMVLLAFPDDLSLLVAVNTAR
jgi:hypothetical protein